MTIYELLKSGPIEWAGEDAQLRLRLDGGKILIEANPTEDPGWETFPVPLTPIWIGMLGATAEAAMARSSSPHSAQTDPPFPEAQPSDQEGEA